MLFPEAEASIFSACNLLCKTFLFCFVLKCMERHVTEGSQFCQSFLTESIWELQAAVKFYELTSEVLNAKVRGAITAICR